MNFYYQIGDLIGPYRPGDVVEDAHEISQLWDLADDCGYYI